MEVINLDEKIEYRGYWYLPSNPDNSVAGIVTYYPNEKIELELIGSFDKSISDIFKDSTEETVIHGKTSDAKDVTLLHCHRYSSLNFSAGFPIVNFSCDFMIIGRHITGIEEKSHYWATIRIPELTHWCHPNAIELTLWNDDGEKDYSRISISCGVKYRDKENIINEVQIDENTSIALIKGVKFDESKHRLTAKMEQFTYIEIHKNNACSIKELLVDICVFEQFLSFATLNIVKCSSITIYDKNYYHEDKKQKFYRTIEIIHPFFERQKTENRPVSTYDFLFDYATIKEVFPGILKKWYYDSKDLAPIRGHLLSSLERKKIYSSVDFLIIVQAIEGFYRRFRSAKYRKEHNLSGKSSSKLYHMIEELIIEFSDIDLLSRSTIDIDAVVDSRQYFSHFMPKNSTLKTIDGWVLLEEARKLRILLLCCVLSLLGFNHSQINDILNKSDSRLFEEK